MIYRKACTDDIPALAQLRRRQLIEEGLAETCDLIPALEDFFRRKLAAGEITEWLAEDEVAIAATGAVMFFEFPPNFNSPRCYGAYITNMYTLPEYRRRGLATSLLERLEREALAADASRIWLGASDMGRPVYEKFGFITETRQMKKELKEK